MGTKCPKCHFESTFAGFKNMKLFWQCWKTENDPAAVIVFVPGIGDHSGRHMTLVNHLLKAGYWIFAFDLRGSGRSSGQRGHINSWDELRNDIEIFVRMVREENEGVPMILFGFSMGSLVLLEYLLRTQVNYKGVITVSSPLGEIGVTPLLRSLARIGGRLLPRLSFNMKINKEWISRDPKVVEAQKNDPHAHGKASLRMGTEFEKAVSWTQENGRELKIPLLMLHGSANRIAEPDGSKSFFDKVLIKDKKIIIYEGAYHELDDEINKDEVLGDITDWLASHVH